MNFVSTRNKENKVSFSEALVKGIANDGGLFVPESFPKISQEEMEQMIDMEYKDRANLILSKFATDFTYEEIDECTEKAYTRFDGEPAPVVKMDDGVFVMELFHGPTLAFKDIALTLFPRMLSKARIKAGSKEDILILVATSGDTGKAALEGFKDVPGIKIIVFYPSEGVAMMQKLQMSTQLGDNVYVAAIEGNFDNCQTGVKEIFTNDSLKKEFLKKGYSLSSANSINLGRLLPQVVYYFSSYLDLIASEEIEMGDEINYSVPTGNFGDILAGIYAKEMGLPVGKFVCASNSNDVLTEFFATGKYDSKREFYKTISPSMDILISSNLERLLFELCDRDDKKVVEYMTSLKETGSYKISKEELEKTNELLYAGMATEVDTRSTIKEFYEEYGYVLDPHTAVGQFVANSYEINENDYSPMIVLSTASPFKFSSDVLEALGERTLDNPFDNAKKLKRVSAEDLPIQIEALEYLDVRFTDVFKVEEMTETVRKFLD